MCAQGKVILKFHWILLEKKYTGRFYIIVGSEGFQQLHMSIINVILGFLKIFVNIKVGVTL